MPDERRIPVTVVVAALREAPAPFRGTASSGGAAVELRFAGEGAAEPSVGKGTLLGNIGKGNESTLMPLLSNPSAEGYSMLSMVGSWTAELRRVVCLVGSDADFGNRASLPVTEMNFLSFGGEVRSGNLTPSAAVDDFGMPTICPCRFGGEGGILLPAFVPVDVVCELFCDLLEELLFP